MPGISHPGRPSDQLAAIEHVKQRAEMEHLQCRVEQLSLDLAAIFDGIRDGGPVELTYPDGTVVPITKARRRGAGETEG